MRVFQNIVKPTARMRECSAKIRDDKKAFRFHTVSQRKCRQIAVILQSYIRLQLSNLKVVAISFLWLKPIKFYQIIYIKKKKEMVGGKNIIAGKHLSCGTIKVNTVTFFGK